jgi:hypothetical protein
VNNKNIKIGLFLIYLKFGSLLLKCLASSLDGG